MSAALRALVLLACSWSAWLHVRNARPEAVEELGGWVLLPFAAIVVPFAMAVAVAWKGDRDGRG